LLCTPATRNISSITHNITSIPPVFNGNIQLCYTNIQNFLVLMTTFVCSYGPQLNMNRSHSHPFHQICIFEEWIQICFCAISESKYYDILSCRTPYEGLYMEWRMTICLSLFNIENVLFSFIFTAQ
jgi:hypothetical protein